jgi:hypothetical protein
MAGVGYGAATHRFGIVIYSGVSLGLNSDNTVMLVFTRNFP